MPKQLNLNESYDKCIVEGNFLPQSNIDINKIKSMLNIIEEDLLTINDLKNSTRFNTLCKLNYDVIHTLTEALLLFDKIKATNHVCLYVYLCIKHSELELSWDFFERIRTKRNGIHYYGSSLNKNDWKELNFQTNLYVKTLQTELKNKIKEFNKSI